MEALAKLSSRSASYFVKSARSSSAFCLAASFFTVAPSPANSARGRDAGQHVVAPLPPLQSDPHRGGGSFCAVVPLRVAGFASSPAAVTPASTHNEVLAYWFGGEDSHNLQPQFQLWFQGGEAVDEEITARFKSLYDKAAAGELDHWKHDPKQCVALVVLLDQFSRNIHRGSPLAFAADSKALEFAQHALAKGWLTDGTLHPIQASFLQLPFEHAEDPAMQEISIKLAKDLGVYAREAAGEELKGMFDAFLTYAQSHKDIIDRFGRYPHRNEVLGRTSTPEEVEYLEGGAERFGQ